MRLAALAIVTVGLAAGPAMAAGATQGSVPEIVADYAADPHGLVGRLADLFGKGAGGRGLDFDDSTKVGEIDRAFVWRDDFLAGATDAHPVKRVNEWTATISIAGKPVGVATIWINPSGNVADLADFQEDASMGAAFTGIPADAFLVHDAAHSAWFALEGDTLTVLVPGSSGVDSTTSLLSYRRQLATAIPVSPTDGPMNEGTINSIIVIVVAVLAVIAVVVFLGRRRAARDASAPAPTEPAVPLPAAAPARAAPAVDARAVPTRAAPAVVKGAAAKAVPLRKAPPRADGAKAPARSGTGAGKPSPTRTPAARAVTGRPVVAGQAASGPVPDKQGSSAPIAGGPIARKPTVGKPTAGKPAPAKPAAKGKPATTGKPVARPKPGSAGKPGSQRTRGTEPPSGQGPSSPS